MTDEIVLAERFEAERPRLRGLAMRMLGGDARRGRRRQEAWIRLVRTDQARRGHRQPPRLADHRGVADLPGPAAQPDGAPRGGLARRGRLRRRRADPARRRSSWSTRSGRR